MARDDTFESVYPRYDFAPLVELAILAGGGLKRLATILAGYSARSRSTAIDGGVGHAA